MCGTHNRRGGRYVAVEAVGWMAVKIGLAMVSCEVDGIIRKLSTLRDTAAHLLPSPRVFFVDSLGTQNKIRQLTNITGGKSGPITTT